MNAWVFFKHKSRSTNKVLSIVLMIFLTLLLMDKFFGRNAALKTVAYWVVFGLPILLIFRIYQLFQIKDKPRNFYIGSLILYLGIAVWIPFALFKRILGMDISVIPFLIAHLAGTSSGVMLRRLSAK